MSPMEFWWLYDAKRPRSAVEAEQDKWAELYDLLED